MGDCVYCGQPAGFFRKRHRACQERFDSATQRIHAMIAGILESEPDFQKFETEIGTIAQNAGLQPKQLRMALCAGWADAVEMAFEDGVLSEEEERRLEAIVEQFGLDQDELDRSGALERFAKGSVIREILDGRFPESRQEIKGTVPFNYQKSEKPIWIFPQTNYLEVTTRRELQGESQGFSVRVASGVYYRVGGFKGRTVERAETIDHGAGLFGVTNKHIYYAGAKTFRIRLDKIVAIEPYHDGIGIQRDAASAKPQSFVTGDGWFTYNLVANAGGL